MYHAYATHYFNLMGVRNRLVVGNMLDFVGVQAYLFT